MIDRQNGKVVFECDLCSDTFEPGTGDFNKAWDAAKEEGWTAKKVGDVFTHSCAACEEAA